MLDLLNQVGCRNKRMISSFHKASSGNISYRDIRMLAEGYKLIVYPIPSSLTITLARLPDGAPSVHIGSGETISLTDSSISPYLLNRLNLLQSQLRNNELISIRLSHPNLVYTGSSGFLGGLHGLSDRDAREATLVLIRTGTLADDKTLSIKEYVRRDNCFLELIPTFKEIFNLDSLRHWMTLQGNYNILSYVIPENVCWLEEELPSVKIISTILGVNPRSR